jgi:predicted ATPase
MRVKSIRVANFRSYVDQAVTFEPAVTTFVGENNVGKSSLGLALLRAVGGSGIVASDLPRKGAPQGQHPQVEVTLTLGDDEASALVDRLIPRPARDGEGAGAARWLLAQGSDLVLTVKGPGVDPPQVWRWGHVFLRGTTLRIGSEPRQDSGPDILGLLSEISNGKPDDREVALRENVGKYLIDLAQNSIRFIDDFRTRGSGTSATLEALSGAETVSVLCNLHSHPLPAQRQRYRTICEAFRRLFPRYEIEAVRHPDGTPEVQIIEDGDLERPLTLYAMSAGVYQAVTLLTNILGRQHLVFVVEHPEAHLHPHAMRFMHQELMAASTWNQIIVITHDPHFVDPDAATSLRRFWWTPSGGTVVKAASPAQHAGEDRQRQTALQRLHNREVVFARSVIVTEDETHQRFLYAIAPTLGQQIDANGVSIVGLTEGDSGYPAYFALLDALGIPFIAVKDRRWGDDRRYPPDRFFTFTPPHVQGKWEIEDFLDHHGLKELRKAVGKEVTGNKPRVAEALGRRLSQEQIPELFTTILARSIELANARLEMAPK